MNEISYEDIQRAVEVLAKAAIQYPEMNIKINDEEII